MTKAKNVVVAARDSFVIRISSLIRHSSFVITHHELDETQSIGLSGRAVRDRVQRRLARCTYFRAFGLSLEKTNAHFADQLRRRDRHKSEFRGALCRRAGGTRDRYASSHCQRTRSKREQEGRCAGNGEPR